MGPKVIIIYGERQIVWRVKMRAKFLLSITLAFSLILAGCSVGPGLALDADHTLIVSSEAFRQAELVLGAEGVVVNVLEPLSYDAVAGMATFGTSDPGVFVHATVRSGAVAAVVVMTFDDAGGWDFTDYVSGARARGDVTALDRLAASADLDIVATSDLALADELLNVFAIGAVDTADDGVQVLCAARSAEQGRLTRANLSLAGAVAGYASSYAAFLSCLNPIACAAAVAWNQAMAGLLALAMIAQGEAVSDLNACRARNSC